MLVIIIMVLIGAVWLKIHDKSVRQEDIDKELEQYARKQKKRIDDLEDLPEIQKQGFRELVKLCLADKYHENANIFIDSLKDFNKDDYYLSSLNYVMEHFEDENIEYLIALDWKEAAEELQLRIVAALKSNFGIDFVGPDMTGYLERTSIYDARVFRDFDEALQKQGFQITFIDTQSDEYVIFIHRTKDKLLAEQAVNKIGYKYFHAWG